MPRIFVSFFALAILSVTGFAQTALQLRGRITDPSGAAIPGATITINGGDFARSAEANVEGEYVLTGLQSGKFTLRVISAGFSPFERVVNVGGNRPLTLDIALTLAVESQQITVSDTAEINLDPSDPSSNVGALVLKGEDLDVLSDNPDDLQSDLEALAGPSAGPNGGQIFIDGFSGGRLPPKESIREIRINSNPFSAEYDKLGFGRIEILTKPGTDKFRGSAFFNFTDAVFNSRNPYSTIRPPYQQKFFGGNLSGPVTKKSSFFIEVDRRQQDETSAINAITLDPNSFQPTPFSTAILNPRTRTTVNPRFDYQLNANNTLVARYEWTKFDSTNSGLSALTLPTRGISSGTTNNTLQLTETAVLGAKAINETRFQYIWVNQDQSGDNSTPGINVQEAFQGGGANLGLAYNRARNWELANSTSLTQGSHMIKFGGRLRGNFQDDYTTTNYNGTYTFNSLTSYQLQLQGMANGLTNEQIRALGGGPSQFTLSTGIPLASVSQYDVGIFITDDWRIKPNFTLSTGLRYETQNNISSNYNFAPRIGFAWGVGSSSSGRTPKTVIRGGWGMFYDRFDSNYTLQANRINPLVQQQFFVTLPNFYPTIPTGEELSPYLTARTTRLVYSHLNSPYIMQGMVSVERQLPRRSTLAVTYVNSRGLNVLRTRNINAPLTGTYDPTDPNSGVRPYGLDAGNIYLYESSGSFKQNQMIVNMRTPLSTRINLFGFYTLNFANSNTDGIGSFPANTYDMTSEWGRAQFDTRHRMVVGGSITTWKGISLNPFVMANTGAPFNITLGRDLNGDNQFTERPALVSTGTTGSNIIATPYGTFDTNPAPGSAIIARNYAQGPGQFVVNLRASKTWGWGERSSAQTGTGADGAMMGGPPMGGGGPGRGGPRGGGGGGMRGGRGSGGFGGGSSGKKYSLNLSVSARNLLNHVNPGAPIGNLSSPLFGISNALGGGMFSNATANRRIDLQLRFNF